MFISILYTISLFSSDTVVEVEGKSRTSEEKRLEPFLLISCYEINPQ